MNTQIFAIAMVLIDIIIDLVDGQPTHTANVRPLMACRTLPTPSFVFQSQVFFGEE